MKYHTRKRQSRQENEIPSSCTTYFGAALTEQFRRSGACYKLDLSENLPLHFALSLGGRSSSADRFTNLQYFQIPNTPRVSLGVSKEQRFKTRLLKMCPLRIILIFLSASLAGLMAWRAFCSKERFAVEEKDLQSKNSSRKSPPASLAWEKVVFAFWTLVDMGSGRYLWRNLISNRDSDKAKAC